MPSEANRWLLMQAAEGKLKARFVFMVVLLNGG